MPILTPPKRVAGLLGLLLAACTCDGPAPEAGRLFTLLPPSYTGIRAANRLADENSFNVFRYRNFYNGGGVAVGDVNNDGLPDIYMVANSETNRLYLNRGDIRFRDVTSEAGVGGRHNWSTGACMVDINGDGWLDIYVCNSGNIAGDSRANELFINLGLGDDGTPLFREAAAEYGLDDPGYSTHAAFFDYDRDGDLDMYLLNNAFRALTTFDLSQNLRQERDPYGGDRLYRNDGGRFVDVSAEAGIYGSVIGFGLGLSISDIDNDGWLDIYVANDFFERDYLYINNGDGTFSEEGETLLRLTSLASMGSDIADLNNDGRMDIYTTDMLPSDDYRLKTTFSFEAPELREQKAGWGYHQQVSRNMLQLNNGQGGAGQLPFSEVALLAGVAASDWSWGVLLADLDNDGLKDIFVSNGIYRDVTDQDYLEYLSAEENMREILSGDRIDFSGLIARIPSTPLPNVVFRNEGGLRFTDRAAEWGLDQPSFSNGAVYADLDGDGDNDLVINNVNQPAAIYRNESDSQSEHHYLQVRLIGSGGNTGAIGARVTLKKGREQFVLEQMPMRVFQSSLDYRLTFGLGRHDSVDSLIVDWPDGARTTLRAVAAGQLLTLQQSEASVRSPQPVAAKAALFTDITAGFPLTYRHVENRFVDFHREPLMPRKLSTDGPRMAVGDVNGDGLDDLFIGGAKGFAGQLLVQTAAGGFESTNEDVLTKHLRSEDVDATLFDADGDGDLDLYVVSGGNEFPRRNKALRDRLYINDGQGVFTHRPKALPAIYASGSCVVPGDVDGDGDLDLFVGSRSLPWRYGLIPSSYLLLNDGAGNFVPQRSSSRTGPAGAGMVTAASWLDYDGDGLLDLVVVGEWMPITLYRNTGGGRLLNVTGQAGLGQTNGWWNSVAVADLDNDGRPDIIAGNWGHNSILKPTLSSPVLLYVADFDGNGRSESILAYPKESRSYPLLMRSNLLSQLPYLGERFPRHADYAGKQVTEIFNFGELLHAARMEAYTFTTSVFYGTASGVFREEPLPLEAQFSPVFAILAEDFDGNGTTDLLLGGNFYGMAAPFGRQDAGYGTFLSGDGKGGFMALPNRETGLALAGAVRHMLSFSYQNGRRVIVVARNDAPALIYEVAPGD